MNPPKLIEYNPDTPQALIEAGAAQLHWIRECFDNDVQWNRLQDAIVERWKVIAGDKTRIHLGYSSVEVSGEDAITVAYLADLARAAGLDAQLVELETVDFDSESDELRTNDGERVEVLFKLFPWEDILMGKQVRRILRTLESTIWIEPA